MNIVTYWILTSLIVALLLLQMIRSMDRNNSLATISTEEVVFLISFSVCFPLGMIALLIECKKYIVPTFVFIRKILFTEITSRSNKK